MLILDSDTISYYFRGDPQVVTRNIREFSRVPGLQCLNWHQDS